MNIAVIGCTHAGTAAITNIANTYPDATINVYEKNDNVSFLSCGIALYVGGVVPDPKGLFYASPAQFQKLGVNMRMQHEVLDVDVNAHSLRAKNLVNGKVIHDHFDKLIIATGSWPIVPTLPGSELHNIQLCKNFQQANDIIAKGEKAEHVTVIGAGYIGVELAEAFAQNGKRVTLMDSEPRILSKYLDQEFTQPVEDTLKAEGVELALGQMVTAFEGDSGSVQRVVTTKGTYEADMVISCIGFRPNTELFKGQLDMQANGALIVDEYMQTSAKDVFAAGDCCVLRFNPTGQQSYIPLATNAVRTGTLVAMNLVSPTVPHPGTQGTSGLKLFQHHLASTGMTETQADRADWAVETVAIQDAYRPEFMPTAEEVLFKIVYDQHTRRVLGAQILSDVDLTQAVNTLSVCIQNNMTVDQLAFQDFFFQPHFNKPWHFINRAGMKAMEKQGNEQKEKRIS
ncbi:FAD-dependent oxidoreductase [Aureibacillus halotolerans]|uniref:NADPH-dependent 2,4-dienoyl-CoA reductase/sulfur reductase-like enzyme n=1 Tax=Aureibacillus halotolerans TaxID=1508390 RepID=A0A4R6TT28_9BACI|nr:FAD-dependent oxidoreductase [Aureibacillus halotolerans]TDQ36246.1 NADPH-dependent 2,4-dienoyl-CoA reductase/sulfur reductase-like enzyme [Aureibacillus halotolerans]